MRGTRFRSLKTLNIFHASIEVARCSSASAFGECRSRSERSAGVSAKRRTYMYVQTARATQHCDVTTGHLIPTRSVHGVRESARFVLFLCLLRCIPQCA